MAATCSMRAMSTPPHPSSRLYEWCHWHGCREERGGDDGVLVVQLTGGAVGGGAEVQLARSSWALPAFQRLSLTADAGSTSIVLPPQQVGCYAFGWPRGAFQESCPITIACCTCSALRAEGLVTWW